MVSRIQEKQANAERLERAWVSFSKHGDKESFNLLFDSTYNKYCRLAFLFLGDRTDAEDVVQEVFTNLWKSRASREPREYGSGVDSYMYKAVKNRCLNRIRDRKGAENLNAAEDIESRYCLGTLDERDIRAVVDDALGRLPEKCRKVFMLSRFGDKSNRAIADETNLSEKSVEAYITRAIKALKSAFNNY